MSASNNITQISLAIIGLVGALGGAVIANWDKFAQPAIPSTRPASTVSVAPVTFASAEIKNSGPTPERPKDFQSQPRQDMPSVGPSFDCAKATHRSELLIYSSPDLAVLDLAMSNAYREAAARVRTKGRKAALRDLQSHWLRRVREACADVECLRAAYQLRIRELDAIQL